jgi:hypothetical protein
MENLVGIFREFDPLDLGLALGIEQADLDLRRMGREQTEIDPFACPGRTTRVRKAFAKTRHCCARH